MSQTALQYISQAASKVGAIGLGESLDATEAFDYLSDLNDLLDLYNIQTLKVFHTKDFTGQFVAGQGAYTIGPGQDFNVIRPVRIQNIYQNYTQISYNIEEVTNGEFDSIVLKQLQTPFPTVFYYETSYPYGIIHFYPIPTIANDVVISFDDQQAVIATLQQVMIEPPGYSMLIKMELALLIAAKNGLAFSNENQVILDTARDAVQTNNHEPAYNQSDPMCTRTKNNADYTFIYTGGFD